MAGATDAGLRHATARSVAVGKGIMYQFTCVTCQRDFFIPCRSLAWLVAFKHLVWGGHQVYFMSWHQHRQIGQ
jgi:hypothetical protein